MLTAKEAILHSACLLDAAYVPLYIVLVVLSILSAVVPFLFHVSSHGKTRQERARSSSRLQYFSNGQVFLVEKRYFQHFYITGLASMLGCIMMLAASPPTSLDRGYVPHETCLVVLACHLVRRTYECQYVHKWRTGSKMHFLGYVLGVGHYLWLPFMFVKLPCRSFRCQLLLTEEKGVVTNVIAALYRIPIWLFSMDPDCWEEDATASKGFQKYDLAFLRIPLLVVCLWAQYQQYVHHVLLANLRRNHPKKTDCNSNTYSIPVGRWFDYVSAPHYLAEVLIYICFALLLELEPNLPGGNRHWLMLVFVVTNLSISSFRTHQWYEANLPNYDRLRRRAMIPYVF